MSFSFCSSSAIARANRSDPPPGPVWTTASICLLGLNSWPAATPRDIATITATMIVNHIALCFIFFASQIFRPRMSQPHLSPSAFTLNSYDPPGAHFMDRRQTYDHGYNEQQYSGNRTRHQDRDVTL